MLDQISSDFSAKVADEVRGRLSSEESTELRAPDMLRPWYEALTSLKHTTEETFIKRDTEARAYHEECKNLKDGCNLWYDYSEEYFRWRISAIYFKGCVEKRMREVKAQLDKALDDRLDEIIDREDYLEEVLSKICTKLEIMVPKFENEG